MENKQIQITPEQQLQIDSFVINIKLNLLALAKDMIKDNVITDTNARELYLDLREEILGIPNPKNQKENGTKD